MPLVDRFTVSLDTELLAAFDGYMAARGYENRSEAIRDLIRDALVSNRATDAEGEFLVIVTGVCDAGVSDAANRLRLKLAACAEQIVTQLSFPIDERRTAVAVILRGASAAVRALASEIVAMRGIVHGKSVFLEIASR